MEVIKDNRQTLEIECCNCKSVLRIHKSDLTAEFQQEWYYKYYCKCPLCNEDIYITPLQFSKLNNYI